MVRESDGDSNRNWCARYSPQRTGKGTVDLGNKRSSGDHFKYSILITILTEKKPGNLKRLSVTQTSVKTII